MGDTGTELVEGVLWVGDIGTELVEGVLWVGDNGTELVEGVLWMGDTGTELVCVPVNEASLSQTARSAYLHPLEPCTVH